MKTSPRRFPSKMATELIYILLGLSLLEPVYSLSAMLSGPQLSLKENKDGYLSQAQKDAMLNRHNEYRHLANAKHMNTLKWSDELARHSDEAAKECKIEHTKVAKYGDWSRGGYGENIYMGQIGPSGALPADYAVYKWWDEIVNYDYTNLVLTAFPVKDKKKQWGHYTQVMWADTTSVGCGVRHCKTIKHPIKSNGKVIDWREDSSAPNGWWMIFCQYNPPGNYQMRDPFKCDGEREKCNHKNFDCQNRKERDECWRKTMDCARSGDCEENCLDVIREKKEDCERKHIQFTPEYKALGTTSSLQDFYPKKCTDGDHGITKKECVDLTDRPMFRRWKCHQDPKGYEACCASCSKWDCTPQRCN